jgi:chondroitin AC lyase
VLKIISNLKFNRFQRGNNTSFMKKIAVVIIFLLVICVSQTAIGQFVHPGMLNSKAEMEFVKKKISGHEEPWHSAFKMLQSDDHAKPEWKARPIADVIRGSYNNPNIGAGDLGNDAQAAYIQALEWVLTGDEKYAGNAIAILNAWSYTLKSITGADQQLLAGITGYKFCNAAEIIKHTCNKWEKADQEEFNKMLLTIFYPLIKSYRPQSNGNWDAAMIVTTMCIGIFTDNIEMYKGAVEYARNGKSTGAIPNYICESGQCQESGRDQGHTQLGLGFLGDVCEVAWKQGDDLYSAFDNRLATGFEYTAKYNLGFDVPYDPIPDIFGNHLNPSISAKGRGSFRPIYEKIYHHYHDRAGMEMKYTKMVLDKIQPEGFHWDHASFGTLMYCNYPSDLDQLHQNVRKEILEGSVDPDRVQQLCYQLNTKGEWPGIDYASKQRGDWPTAGHLGLLQTLAKAYQKPGTKFYHDQNLLVKIHLALNYWLNNDFENPNWWYPQIGVPMSLAPTLVIMEAELSPEQMAQGIKILDRAKIGMTGQNKVWLSGNVLIKSLLLRDAQTIRKASGAIQEELKVSMQEGIQTDGSFHQHGPQIQFGNYGLSYVSDMIKWVGILRNTPFQFDETKISILRNYLLNGQQWITWKKQMDISACGRQLFVNAQQGKARSLANSFRQMETIDPGFADVYKKANQYANLTGNKHFFRSDFQVQRTPEYYFSVKMCSERVIGAESCNSENIRGYYLGDGATYLYQSGNEYENIFPFWDWKKIPGTTTSQDDKELPILTASGYRIQSSFVGGVSDGSSGIAVMDYNRNGLKARKSWFIFNNQVVCLGAGICSSEGFPVTTTVNQSFLEGETVVKEKSEKTIPDEASENMQPVWILHGHTGYYFPEGGNMKLETKTVTGSWKRVAMMYNDAPTDAGIFKLWFEHSVNPVNKTYAYILIPGATKSKMQQMETKPSFKILKNNPEIQVVVSADGSIGGVVFYKAGKSDMFGGIEAGEPCIVMLKKVKRGLEVSVSDPTQKLSQIHLAIKGNFKMEHPSATLKTGMGNSGILINLPKDDVAGKTVSMVLERQK